MTYPEIPIEINYFMFGVIIGTLFTTGMFVIMDYVNKKQRNKRLNEVGVFRREDCSEEFLKTIDGIEENLKRKKE